MNFEVNLDWELLREQKLALYDVAYSSDCSLKVTRALEGLISLLDHLQDSAIESQQSTELDVFGTEENIED